MKKTTSSKVKRKRRQEAVDLVKFIDAHGGKLGAFRGYGTAQPTDGTRRAT